MVAVFAALPFAASAQSDKVVETVRESPLSKDDMWHNLRRWVSLTFDRSDVIDMEDAGRGTMIVKWACPVKASSEFIDPVVSETYQIDVREGRYRVRCLAPKISFRIVRPAGFDEYMPLNSADINLITGLAQRFYGGSLDWPVDETYDNILNAYVEYLDGTPKYRSDRDREKGKVSDEWKTAEHNWKVLHDVREGLDNLNASMLESLNKSLTANDDF